MSHYKTPLKYVMPPLPATLLPELPPIPPLERADVPKALRLRPMQPEEAHSFGSFHWSVQAFRNELQNQLAHYVVLEHVETKQLLGYMGCWFVASEGHITTLATHPYARQLSLAELMLTHLYTLATQQGLELLTLEVRTTNNAAQNLYYKYGFRQMGKRPRYYQDNQEDALLLTTPSLQSEGQVGLVEECIQQLKETLGGFPVGHILHKALP
jgi:[ribosomal protein S18]-alanine N-acetyltransferase